MHIKHFLYLSLLVSIVYSQSIETLFEENNYKDACEMVDRFYVDNPQSYKANLYYAKCAEYRGNIHEAVAAHDRAEILKEDNNFFALLAHISGGVDSNVKYSAEIWDMNEWFEIDSYSDEPESDLFVKQYLRFTHLYLRNSYTSYYYKNQLHLYNKNYAEFSEDDFTQIELYSGGGWSNKGLNIWLPLSITYMATDYKSYARVFSFKPQIKKHFQNRILLEAESGYEYQKYQQWSEGDKNIYYINLDISKWLGSHYLQLGYNYVDVKNTNSNSTRIFVDRDSHEFEINYTKTFANSLKCGLGYFRSKTVYKDVAVSTSLQKREDNLQKYSAYLSYNIIYDIEAVISYDSYVNDSNYTPSDYTKELYTVSLYLYF